MSGNKQELQPVRGMRDFYPEEYRMREKLFSVWRDVALRFGFEQFEAPIVESLDLFKRKAGEEIIDQIYYFQDKSGRELALRPELTPSLVRMVTARKAALKFPLKWFSIAQCFRYERMTRGRRREHYQWNLDIIGESEQLADAELIAAAVNVLQCLDLTADQVVVKINSRQLLMDILADQGFQMSNFMPACLILDKRGKIDDQEIRRLLNEHDISDKDIEIIFDVLRIKSFEDAIGKTSPDSVGARQLTALFENCKAFGIGDYLEFDISVIRGLSYYTGIVFEAFDREARFRAIFGGGRYDHLLKSMTGTDLPACGLGFGDVVIGEVLNYFKNKKINRELDYVVCYTDIRVEKEAIDLTTKLRESGCSTSLLYGATRAKKGLQYANDANAKKVALLDPREVFNGEYIIKDLDTGKQEVVRLKN